MYRQKQNRRHHKYLLDHSDQIFIKFYKIKSLLNSLVLHLSSVYLILLYVEWFFICFVVVENHLSHQHHQFVHISPGLQHKVAWMARHGYIDIYVAS